MNESSGVDVGVSRRLLTVQIEIYAYMAYKRINDVNWMKYLMMNQDSISVHFILTN